MSSNAVNAKTTAKDAEFMYCVVQHIEGKPNVNWDSVAAVLGYKSGTVASTRFNQIKKKMEGRTAGPASTSRVSGVNGATSGKPTAKPKRSKVTKAQTGKTQTRRKLPAAPQTPKEDDNKVDKEDGNEDINDSHAEEVTRAAIEYATAAALASVAENNNANDNDSGVDYDMVESEDPQGRYPELKFEDFDADEEEYMMVMDGEDEGDADDEQ